MEAVEKVARAVLYEGYLLYPYTRSTTKNQQRWTFGGVYPWEHSEATGGDDPWLMQTECLILGDAETEIEIKLRFLHIVDRAVLDPSGQAVAELRVGETVYRPWDESIERERSIGPLPVGQTLKRRMQFPIRVETGAAREELHDGAGPVAGTLERSWHALEGSVEVEMVPVDDGCYRLRVTVTNFTAWDPSMTRPEVLRRTLISTHTILRAQGGEFISSLEPPGRYQNAVQACRNIKTWPVLAGEPGERQIVLSSPIILYDYPQVAPESPGDLFDATEIDELLTLTLLALTDEERQEVRESDPRGREILERTESLTPEQVRRLHGTIRSLQQIRPEDP